MEALPAADVAQYPIRAVAQLTGLSIDTLRAWERRYNAVTPTRDDRGRVYSVADVTRLRLLQRAVVAGHNIGRLARLGDTDLDALLDAPAAPARRAPSEPAIDLSTAHAALGALDDAALDRELARLAACLEPLELVQHVIVPLMHDVGEAWHRTRAGISREHMMSATLRHLLGTFLRIHGRSGGPGRLLFATPARERHEIGVLAAAMLAASRGLGVSYLGSDLPADEIIDAARVTHARVVVLSVTMPGPRTTAELGRVARGLPGDIELWVGGPRAAALTATLDTRTFVVPDYESYHARIARFARHQTS